MYHGIEEYSNSGNPLWYLLMSNDTTGVLFLCIEANTGKQSSNITPTVWAAKGQQMLHYLAPHCTILDAVSLSMKLRPKRSVP